MLGAGLGFSERGAALTQSVHKWDLPSGIRATFFLEKQDVTPG